MDQGSSSRGSNLLVCTDSQAATKMLEAGPSRQNLAIGDKIWKKLKILSSRECHTTIQWIPGHAGLVGNDAADAAANEATKLNQQQVPIDFKSAKNRVRSSTIADWRASVSEDSYVRRVGHDWQVMGDKAKLTRREAVEVSRLRTGHSLLLREYRQRIGLDDSPICPACNGDSETLIHLIEECPAHCRHRLAIFGQQQSINPRDGGRVAAYLRRLGRL